MTPMNHTNNHPETFLSQEMNRRKFLTLCALGTITGILAGCQNEKPSLTKATPIPTKRPVPNLTKQASPTAHPSLTDEDWSVLAKSLQGTLVRPDNIQYPTARQLFNPRFDNVWPAAIAYCSSPTDVQTCLAFVRRFGLPLAPRSGGHSYAGYSTTSGLVVDVTTMNTIEVDTGSGIARIGAGARLIDIYAQLAQYGLALPAGTCPTIGIAGLTLGGGIGVLGRKFGLTCDNLLSAQIVAADGRLLTCDTSQNPDLFWALRGGGGGNFGIVTSFTFQVHPVTALSVFTLNWPWASASDVIDAWQVWAPQAPDELWSNCWLTASSDKSSSPVIQVSGVYLGNVAALSSLIQQLIGRINAAPTGRDLSNIDLLDAMMLEADCSGKTVSECHLPSQNTNGQLQRVAYSAKSNYFTDPLPRSGIDAMISAVVQRQSSSALSYGGIGLDAFGGALNRVLTDATAFVHRNALFSAQYIANWNTSDPDWLIAENRSWLTRTLQAMRQYNSGAAYQNYIDPDLPDWQHAYYGSNLPRLQHIKATYDPDNLFHFRQSIPLATLT